MFNWFRNLFWGNVEGSGVRARNKKGRFVADNPDTPDVNEAYVDGKTPTRKKKPAAKKKTSGKKNRKT